MTTFLQKTAEYVFSQSSKNFAETSIVFPNRRAGVFFKKHLSKFVTESTWLPTIFTIEEFILKLSGLSPASEIDLMVYLYDIHHKHNTNETLEEFGKWSKMILNDFNEIDQYLVDASKLYSNLANIKEIEQWSLGLENLTDFQQQYLAFWKQLGSYYNELSSTLLKNKLCYPGLAYRAATDKICDNDPVSTIKANIGQFSKIYFIGFNALNKAEELIIHHLINSTIAEFIPDHDKYYSNDPEQEAGKFIRKYKNKFNSAAIDAWKENLLLTEEKNITGIAVAGNMIQAKVAGELIKDSISKNSTNIAIVLADESLLFPVLNSIPNEVENINVTMGFPLKHASVTSLFTLVFDMQEEAYLSDNKTTIHHRHLLDIINHPQMSFVINKSISREIKRIVSENNLIFTTNNELSSLCTDNETKQQLKNLAFLFEKWTQDSECINCLESIIEIIKNGIRNNPNATLYFIENELLFSFHKLINQLKNDIDKNKPRRFSIKTIRVLLEQAVNSSNIPFEGEPLKGLQVMGMLETRALDFEQVILLSANEGILPSGKKDNSFIPHQIKKSFGLPTHSEKDAVYAYHFYRLMQRCKNAYLLYNTEKDTFGNGEQSRYLKQIEYELKVKNNKINYRHATLNISESTQLKNKIIIQKNKELIDTLQRKKYSPSALNQYRDCPLKFYFSSVIKLYGDEKPNDSIGSDELGTVIHNTLETLYRPYISKHITTADITHMQSQSEAICRDEFKNIKHVNIDQGKNLLTYKIAAKFIRQFFEAEKNALQNNDMQVTILSLEEKLHTELKINDNSIVLYGQIDRIDMVNEITRIIDYKTGLTESKELQIKDISLLEEKGSYHKAFQLLLYSYIYLKSKPQKQISPTIISLRKLNGDAMNIALNEKSILATEDLNEFEDYLTRLLSEILDPNTPFSQTSDTDTCSYCDFKVICNR